MARTHFLKLKCFLSVLAVVLIGSETAFLRAAQQTDSNSAIERLENEISSLSPQVCGLNEPTDPTSKASFDDRKKLLQDDAPALIKLLDQHKADLEKGSILSREKEPLEATIDDEEKALKQDCPSLPDELKKALFQTTGTNAAASVVEKLSISATDLKFVPAQPLQTESAPQQVTLVNTSTDSITLADLSLTTSHNSFRISENTCNKPLAAKATCSFKVTYVPFTYTNDNGFIGIVARGHETRYEELIAAVRAAKDKAAKTVQTNLLKDVAQEPQNDPEVMKAELALRSEFDVISVSGSAEHWKYPLTRATVGLALAAPTSTAIKQSYLVDFDLLGPISVPIPWPLSKLKFLKTNEDPLENRFWGWFNPRITSLPSATNFSALNTIDQSGSFISGQINQATLSIVQGVDVNGGFEWVLVKPRDGIPWWAGYSNTKARLSTSIIAGLGLSTPFSTNTTDVVSVVNQSICDAFGFTPTPTSPPKAVKCIPAPGTSAPTTVVLSSGPTTFPFIDFVTPDRSRFFRRLYTGFRFKTFFFSEDIEADCDPPRTRGKQVLKCAAPYDIFPGVIDVSVGKDEGVTGGAMSTWLFRIEANYPLPFYQGIHVFGSMYTGLGQNKATAPVNSYSIQSPAPGANNDLNTVRFPLTPPNRDYFSVGIGVDLVQVLKKASKGGQPSADAPAPLATNGNTTNTQPASGSQSKTNPKPVKPAAK
jgi:hypothetical protein